MPLINIFSVLVITILSLQGVLGVSLFEFKDDDILQTNLTSLKNNILRSARQFRQDIITIGPCKIAWDMHCPHESIRFHLYTQNNPSQSEIIQIGSSLLNSNLSSSSFDPSLPTKIIIHGYNSGMLLNALVELRRQYMKNSSLNVFAVDWGDLAEGPCYPAAVWNARLAGKCTGQLVERIRETGNEDIHVIGFSLGAHVTNFIATSLQNYKLPRITGLDPAMPGFATVSSRNKLDASDAQFVDVLHTNAFFQGKVEQCGHVDFYMNGGVIQPGCWSEDRSFACNHHRAPYYFAESVNSVLGFWGWPCASYADYLLGRCPPREPQILMGEHISKESKGMYLVITESIRPFAVGKFTGPTIEILKIKNNMNRKNYHHKNSSLDCSLEEFLNEIETQNKIQQKNNDLQEMFEDIDDLTFPTITIV